MDSIALDENKNQFLLGERSFLKKEYHLQHLMEHNKLYELFIVNNSKKTQQVSFFEKNEKSIREISKLPLARPIVFKHMKSSFDVFHG
jgi:hypothetical protein